MVESTKNHKPDRFQSDRATLWVHLNPCCSRHGSRLGQVDHKGGIKQSSGRRKPAFGGSNQSIGVVAKLARCPTSRCALRLTEWTDLIPSNASIYMDKALGVP